MSEYVEARYAKLVLREAEVAKDDVASKLVNDLLHDLNSPQQLNSARAQALTSIRVLAHRLHQPHSFHVREWEAALQAAEDWCQNAYR
jgi:DNA-binding transcriptional regulator YiaG